ncbi:MAG: hypothetical protein ACPLRZ_08610 [Thermovenabulum sp.]|uniref:hypothetical protein n=1 Tax=Thermovenabulum sp. TaxID=3100335 RepID=UPI003C7EC631
MIFKWKSAVNVLKNDLLSVENPSFKPENSFSVNRIKEWIKGIKGKAEKYLSLLSRLSFSVEEISIAMRSIVEQTRVLSEAAKKTNL